MTMNFLITGFILAMAYWWGLQGLFSAFLQLLVIICAGTLAFACWEPMAVGLLMDRMPWFAWGLGLMAPFVLWMVLLRGVLEFLAPRNMYFSDLVNRIGGGVCGLLAGALVAGFILIGIGFLPLPGKILGYQPYVVQNGRVEVNPNSGLWFNVDRAAGRFFSGLSYGAFAPWGRPGQSLALYAPEITRQAALFRMHPDPNATPVARPGTIELTGVHMRDTPVGAMRETLAAAMGEAVSQVGHRVVVVDTRWTTDLPGTFDEDGTLRVAPTQVRLVAWTGSPGRRRAVLHEPAGFSEEVFGSEQRLFRPVTGDLASMVPGDAMLVTANQEVVAGWVFVIPEDQEPRFLLARRSRLPLEPDTTATDAELRTALGVLESTYASALEQMAGQTGDGDPGDPEEGEAADIVAEADLTDALPRRISKNLTASFRYGEDDASTKIIEGRDVVEIPRGIRLSRQTTVDGVYAPSHRAVIRLELGRTAARRYIGASAVGAQQYQQIRIEDSRQQMWKPVGYVLQHSRRRQRIVVEPGGELGQASAYPVAEMRHGETLYLYFSLPRGVTARKFHVGQAWQTLDIEVPEG